MSKPPQTKPYARHIFICTGKFCDPEGKAKALYEKLGRTLGELGRYNNPQRVKRGETPCLGICAGGPLAVVYPDGVWYHHVDEAVLEQIIHEHLKEGCPVANHVFQRLEANGSMES